MIHIEAQNAIPEIAGYLAKGVQRDAVLTEMADYLVRRGAVKESYGSAVIQRENTFPTGIPVEPIAVAIPHSDRDLVVNTTILVAKLEQTVPFHRIDDVDLEVDVKVVFMLAVDSNQGQLDTIARIMELVQDADLIQQIDNAATAEEIQALVSSAYVAGKEGAP